MVRAEAGSDKHPLNAMTWSGGFLPAALLAAEASPPACPWMASDPLALVQVQHLVRGQAQHILAGAFIAPELVTRRQRREPALSALPPRSAAGHPTACFLALQKALLAYAEALPERPATLHPSS